MTLYTDPRADDDIEIGALWLELFNAGAGPTFVLAVNQTLHRLVSQPGFFGPVSRPPRGREVRQGLVDGYPFIITHAVPHADRRTGSGKGWLTDIRLSSPTK